MDRRLFLGLLAAQLPAYKVVTRFGPEPLGPQYRGRVVTVHAEPEVPRMMLAGMLALTGDRDPRDSWARFFTPRDVVGIKINASGAPAIHSSVEVVGEIATNLVAVGVKPQNIWVHERFIAQVRTVDYARLLPPGVHVVTADSFLGYDPFTYVDTSFFGEDDTRSPMVRLVTERLTKIVNVPVMKDHSASGVTGCLKNMAYGEFGNVARSHEGTQTHTRTFIGTLAAVEPLRSRTVLHIMDGLHGVWHAGPFSHNPRFRFSPNKLLFGTDPVAMDRILLDIIDEKRRAEGAISVWDRSPATIERNGQGFNRNPNVNRFFREPGHIEYAAGLGLGEYDKSKIDLRSVEL